MGPKSHWPSIPQGPVTTWKSSPEMPDLPKSPWWACSALSSPHSALQMASQMCGHSQGELPLKGADNVKQRSDTLGGEIAEGSAGFVPVGGVLAGPSSQASAAAPQVTPHPMVPLNPRGGHLGSAEGPTVSSLTQGRCDLITAPRGPHCRFPERPDRRWGWAVAEGRALGCRSQTEKLVPLSRGQWEPLRVSEQRRGGQGDVSLGSLEQDSQQWEEGRGQGLTRRQDSWGLNRAGAAEGRRVQAGPGTALDQSGPPAPVSPL